MEVVKPRRRYHSPARAEQANATRQGLLAAAETLFASRGYPAVTMEAIAKQAGVALATLYLHFPGKQAIIGALADGLAAAPELSVEQVEAESDPDEQLRKGARIMRSLNERSWVIADTLRTLRGSDEELARLWARWQERHLRAMTRAVAAFAARGALRQDSSPAAVADALYALAGPELFRLLVVERGWTPAAYEAWLCRAMASELLPAGSNSPGS